MRNSPVVLVLAISWAYIGCGADSPSGERGTRTVVQTLLNGHPDSDKPTRNATVSITGPNGGCSGSLITSTLVLTASHCDVIPGATVTLGVRNPNQPCAFPEELPNAGPCLPNPPVRARRTVTDVWNRTDPSVYKAAGSPPMWAVARDVAILRLDFPVTMDASPLRPSFARPTLSPPAFGVSLTSFAGGMAGYGLTHLSIADGGGLDPKFNPATRQVFSWDSGTFFHSTEGGGYGIWLVSVSNKAEDGQPVTLPGDSGGPLYQVLPGTPPGQLPHDLRDVIGVSSLFSTGPNSGIPFCPQAFCGPDTNKSWYADITAPPMRAWIEGIVNSGGGTRWEGQTDYPRTLFSPTPGCDIASNPVCDQGCEPAIDRDCDLVLDQNDNCPDDYNPDQFNSDDPVSPFDPSGPFDPGDVCDECKFDKENGDNCNEDAEVLKHGPRPHFREDSMIGNPLFPSPSDQVSIVGARYLGDACDVAPCTQIASKTIELDATKYGSPGPTANGCILSQEFGGHCAYTANVRIERDGRTAPILDGFTGSTGYRVCKCAGPFTTQQQRIQNCFNAGPQCPPLAADFTSPVKLKGLTVDPQFAIIPLASPPEVGTVGDVFTFLPKTVRPSYRWLFENNVNSITGLPNPTLPFTEASAAAIAIDGLVQSNVRQHPLLVSATDTLRDLASYWLPQKLRVEPALVGAKMLQSMSAASGHGDDCLTCGLGFSKPWYLVSPPEMQPVVFAVTEGGPRDMGNRVDADVLALFRSASGAPGRRLIAASEHASLLRKRAKPFAARFTVLDIAELTFLGAVAEDENGRMLQARGRVVGTELAMIACTDGDAISCGAQHTPMVAGVASLSALRGAIFVLRRGSGDTHARLHLFDVLNEVWQETRLVGAMLPVTPLAMTYDAHADALFVIDRAHTGGNGPARLFRIHLDGSVELVENSVGLPHKAEVFLTATEAGNLLLAATRDKNPKLGVLHLEAFGKKAKVLGRFQEKGDLLAAPFLTDRALHILRFRNGNVDALEVDPKKLGPGGGEPQVDLD